MSATAAMNGPCARCGAAGETAYSVAALAVLCRRCYCRLPSAQSQSSSEPPVKLRSARKGPEPYAAFVCRIWDRLAERTGHTVFYLDATHIAAYCPSCLDGTLRIRFLESPRPGMAVSSLDGGPGCCSHGCTERQVIEALA